MSIDKSNIPIEQSSDRNFGFVFAALFLVLACYPLISNGSPTVILLVLAFGLLLIALFIPSVLRIPNTLWHKFGLLLGSIVAPIMLAVVYSVTIVPLGLAMRIAGKKLLDKEFDQNLKSYWIKRKTSPQPMKNQF